MAVIQRPLKEGSVRTYQAKVGLGFPDILASEADADHDTIYAAWNGGVDTVNIKDGAVTTAKLDDLAVKTPKLGDLAVTTAKLADPPNGVTTGKINDLAVTTAKLAAGASLAGFYVLTPGVNLVVGTTVSTVLTFSNVVSRGSVIGIAPLGATVEIAAGLSGNVIMHWFRGATSVGYQQIDVSNATTSILRVPLPGANFYDFATPGTYTYTLQVVANPSGIFFKTGPVPGSSWVLALA